MHCFRANTWYRSENSRVVCVFVSPVLIPYFNQLPGGSLPSYAISVAFARWNFVLHAAKKNNNAAQCFVSLKLNNSEGFIGAPWFFFSFKKRPNVSLYVAYLRTLIWFFKDFSLLIRSLNFTQNDLCATSEKNTNFNIPKNLPRKVRISNSLCSRTV